MKACCEDFKSSVSVRQQQKKKKTKRPLSLVRVRNFGKSQRYRCTKRHATETIIDGEAIAKGNQHFVRVRDGVLVPSK